MYRTAEYRRFQRERHIRRKEAILKAYRPDNMPAWVNSRDLWHFGNVYPGRGYGDCLPYWCVKARGCLSKGKIHCSCKMCRFDGITMQDRRMAGKMLDELLEEWPAASTEVCRLKKMIADSKFV